MIISPFSLVHHTEVPQKTTSAASQTLVSKYKNNLVRLVTDRLKQHNSNFENITQLCLDEISFNNNQSQQQLINNFSDKAQLQQNTVKIIQKCQRIKHLSMSLCKLKALVGFPKLQKLQFLDLSKNQLTQDSYQELAKFPDLIGLNLDENNFSNMQKLKLFLKNMKNLKQISLRSNKFQDTYSLFPSFSTQQHEMAKQLFANCQSLQFVNGIDRNGCDRVSDGESMSSSSSEDNLQMDNIPQQEQQQYNQNQNQNDQNQNQQDNSFKSSQMANRKDQNRLNEGFQSQLKFQQKNAQISQQDKCKKQEVINQISQKRQRQTNEQSKKVSSNQDNSDGQDKLSKKVKFE